MESWEPRSIHASSLACVIWQVRSAESAKCSRRNLWLYLFFNNRTFFNFICGAGNCWCLPSALVNGMMRTKCIPSYSPHSGNNGKYRHFHNNNLLPSTGYPVTVSPQKSPTGVIATTSSLASPVFGHFLIEIECDVYNCVMTQFNFVNNTDTSGYFKFTFEIKWQSYGTQ